MCVVPCGSDRSCCVYVIGAELGAWCGDCLLSACNITHVQLVIYIYGSKQIALTSAEALCGAASILSKGGCIGLEWRLISDRQAVVGYMPWPTYTGVPKLTDADVSVSRTKGANQKRYLHADFDQWSLSAVPMFWWSACLLLDWSMMLLTVASVKEIIYLYYGICAGFIGFYN